jgi:L-asparaginase II
VEVKVQDSVAMVELWRGGILESVHRGHAVICNADGAIVAAWGDPDKVIFPRSSCKILQALPLVESGAAAAAGLGSEHLALACASHLGAPMHTDRVTLWLTAIGLAEPDLRCGNQSPTARADQFRLHDLGQEPCQIHNNCSGKHCGFLTLGRHLKAGPEYVEIDHPVQKAVRQAFEDVTGETSPGYGIDGCSAPNFATSLAGLARGMARMARPAGLGRIRAAAAESLVDAMIAHPLLVEGPGGASSQLMAEMNNVAVKNGAEGVHVAILRDAGLGLAVKIEDGAARAAETAAAALLVNLGALDPQQAVARRLLDAPIVNRRGIVAGQTRLAADFARSLRQAA